jgi:P-type Ca2+ transporter type 2A
VALAVAAIPEGLAVVITTCLALGTRKMAAKNAIVRSLPSVETLGSTNVICSDKTGTLTTNQISVSKVFVVSEFGQGLQEYEIEGTTFSPEGWVLSEGKSIPSPAASNSCIRTLAEIAAVCNDSGVAYDSVTGHYSNIGEPTEAALRVLVEKLGTGQEKLDAQINAMPPYERLHTVNTFYETISPRIATFEFTRDRKSMSVLTQTDSAVPRLLVKGAPESVIARCDSVLSGKNGTKIPMTSHLRDKLAGRYDEYACRGLRVLAFAMVEDMTKRKCNYHNAKSSKDYLQYEVRSFKSYLMYSKA